MTTRNVAPTLLALRSAPRGLTLVAVLALLVGGCGGGGGSVPQPKPMPEGGEFTGVYSSPQYGDMHLVQSGEGVVGEYEKDDRSGTLQGVATGDLLRFRWSQIRELVRGRPTESTGHGFFRYVIGEDGRHYLVGEWWLGDSEVPPEGQRSGWRAYKLRNATPELTRIGTGSGPSSGGEDAVDEEDADEF